MTSKYSLQKHKELFEMILQLHLSDNLSVRSRFIELLSRLMIEIKLWRTLRMFWRGFHSIDCRWRKSGREARWNLCQKWNILLLTFSDRSCRSPNHYENSFSHMFLKRKQQKYLNGRRQLSDVYARFRLALEGNMKFNDVHWYAVSTLSDI